MREARRIRLLFSRASEQPDWQTRLKACRLVLAITFAVIPEFQERYRQTAVDHRTLRVDR